MDNWNNNMGMDNTNSTNMEYNYGGTNNMNNMGETPTNGDAPGFIKYLVLSILETLCCSWIPGVIGIIFTVLFNSAYKSGNIADYESKKKIAKVALWIGLAVGIIANLLIGFLYGASILGAIMGA